MLMFTLMLMLTRMHILPGGSGLLLPVHPHLPHLPSCLPILHCRYVKCFDLLFVVCQRHKVQTNSVQPSEIAGQNLGKGSLTW